jgi:hypothetical protein
MILHLAPNSLKDKYVIIAINVVTKLTKRNIPVTNKLIQKTTATISENEERGYLIEYS